VGGRNRLVHVGLADREWDDPAGGLGPDQGVAKFGASGSEPLVEAACERHVDEHSRSGRAQVLPQIRAASLVNAAKAMLVITGAPGTSAWTGAARVRSRSSTVIAPSSSTTVRPA
jgi:hypothetical protein